MLSGSNSTTNKKSKGTKSEKGSRHLRLQSPILKLRQIVSTLNDLQIPCSLEDLQKPQPQRVLTIYDAFMDLIMCTNRESLIQECPSFSVIDILEYPELHTNSVGLMKFYRKLLTLMNNVGALDFSLKDIVKPEPERFSHLLSALINFIKFREQTLNAYEECLIKSEELLEKKSALEQANKEIGDKINMARLKRSEEGPQVQKYREANESLTAKLRDLKKKQTAINNDIEHLKKEKSEMQEKTNNHLFLINNAKQEVTRLRSRIVHSPEKLQQAISDMNNTVAQEKSNLSSLEKKDRELHGKIEMISMAETDLMASTKLLEDCMSELKRLESVKQQAFSEKENIDKKQSEIRELNVKEQQLKRQLANTEEKMSRLRRLQATKQSSHDEKLEKLKREFESVSNERSSIQTTIDENNALISSTENQILQLKKTIEQDEIQLQSDYNQLKTQIDFYQSQLLSF